MGLQKRKTDRVRFVMGYPARIMAIDGTWHRDCFIEDISQTGAKVAISGIIEGLNLTEFFLVLSQTGHAHRRCQMKWLTGDTMGLRFLLPGDTAKSDRGDRKAGRRRIAAEG